MKKYIQILVVLVLVLTIIGVARNSPAWASGQPSVNAQSLLEIEISESGSYTVGGLCQFNVVYTGSGASAKVYVDIPAESTSKISNSEDQLYLGGCRIVHSVMGEVKNEMSPAYGSWEVCFGDRPDEQLTIYNIVENPNGGSTDWLPLITTVKDGIVCAPANYSGVYAAGGKRFLPDTGNGTQAQQPGDTRGTVRPPAPVNTGKITRSGTYNIGGIASIIISFFNPSFSTMVSVEENTEISAGIPFPDNAGLLYLPGVHVLHYESDKLVSDATSVEGNWKICFASIPNKETTIYFYYVNGETDASVTSVWTPLETTIESGMACAVASSTGIYASASK